MVHKNWRKKCVNRDDNFWGQKCVITKFHRSFQQQVVKIKLEYTKSVYIDNIAKDDDWVAGSVV